MQILLRLDLTTAVARQSMLCKDVGVSKMQLNHVVRRDSCMSFLRDLTKDIWEGHALSQWKCVGCWQQVRWERMTSGEELTRSAASQRDLLMCHAMYSCKVNALLWQRLALANNA